MFGVVGKANDVQTSWPQEKKKKKHSHIPPKKYISS